MGNTIMSLEISGTRADGTAITLTKQTNKFGLVNLTELWQDFGSVEGREPAAWFRTKQGGAMIAKLVEKLKVVDSQLIWKVKIGRGGCTMAHHLLTWAYLSWISPDVMLFMAEAAQEKAESLTGQSLTKAQQTTVKRMRRLKVEDLAIINRLNGQMARKGWAGEMQRKGIEKPVEFAVLTNEIYQAYFGGTAGELKDRLGLGPKDSLRDHLDSDRQLDLDFIESLATRMSQQCLEAGMIHMKALNRNTGKLVRKTVDRAIAIALNGEKS